MNSTTSANQHQINAMTLVIINAFKTTPKPQLPDGLCIFGLTTPEYTFNPDGSHKHSFGFDIIISKSEENKEKDFKVAFSTNELTLEEPFISSIITSWYSDIEKKCNGMRTSIEEFDDHLNKIHTKLREMISHEQVDTGICVNCKEKEATLYLDHTKAELVYCSLKCADEYRKLFHKLHKDL